jgi:tetratricopeptide (TPR) repeat protein
MLIDDGLLIRENGHWRPQGDLSTLALPSSIHALLSARLDRLSEEERAVIQRAAVVGKVFYWGAVAALAPEEMSDRVAAHLQALLRRELIRPERVGFVGEDAFRFSHILVREAAYESVPKRTRAELHQRFAGWLEQKAGQRIVEYEEILGYHLEQAYQNRAALGPVDPEARALARSAGGYLAASGRRATQRGDVRGAVNLLGRASDLLAEDPAGSAVLTDLGVALVEAGEWERAEDVFSEGTEAAARVSDRRLEWLARIHLGHLRGSKDPQIDWTGLLAEAHRAIEVFKESGDDAGLAKAWTLVADIQNGLARRVEMGEAAAKAVEHARRAGDRHQEASSSRMLVASLVFGPTPVREAISRCEEILRDAGESPMLSAALLPPLAHLYGMEGRFEEARALLARARAYHEELGLRHWSAKQTGASGKVEALAGDFVAAEREWRRGCELFREMGETSRFSTVATQLADALYALKRDDEALFWTEESEQAAAPDDLVSQVDWRRVRAKILARKGEIARAEGLIDEALKRAESSADDVHLHDKVYRSVAEVLRLAGRSADAIRYAQRALEVQERKGNIAGVNRSRALLQELKAAD